MIGWLRQKLAHRRATKEAESERRKMAVRQRVMANIPDQPAMTPTTAYETVKRVVDEATEHKRQARETAQKVLRNSPRRK